ncbi:phospholipase A1-IIgamma-like [Olea europaea var. sylvestris]|uniref:phospholipase A1-IIgamma-like n=1 Tax=Olea europaea var. sylvestris TaxID=158386 RepID=UPI000C1CFC2E|nr:phospholipase A1-IIgamma-like [Olea europaea var. sylvestris]
MAQATYDTQLCRTINIWREQQLCREHQIFEEEPISQGRIKGNPFEDILIAWRGTVQAIEWVKDFDFPLVPATKILGKLTGDAKVLSEVRRQVERFKNKEISITVTGLSLGAADIVANGYNRPSEKPKNPCPVTAFKFGSPQVGDLNFKEILLSVKKLHILLSVRNKADLVPHYPPVGYTRIGIELLVDSTISPFLKYPGDITWHILEPAYLHSVAGTKGSEGGFHLEVKRNVCSYKQGFECS